MRLGRGKERDYRGGGYAEWAEYLAAWGGGADPDDSALPSLVHEDFAEDTLRRISDRFTGAINTRLEGWHNALMRATGPANHDEFEYGRALQQGRDGVLKILRLAADTRLTEQLRTELTAMVEGKITDIQAQLERDIERQRDRGDSARHVENRLRTLRTNPITAVITQHRTGAAPLAIPPAGMPTKRVIGR